ncbi:MAG: sulfur carrier protein ThiS [Planctomycetales bacterium]|nr:sulfur carrier protein ThiS [Planctomycetales bacterium]MCA9166995.1 sulfur carrier protein ThiS [Planctomycetales bacterium]
MQVWINGKTRELAAASTLATLLDELQVNRAQVAVEVNEQLVPRQQHGEFLLSDGDRLEIVTLVGGG